MPAFYTHKRYGEAVLTALPNMEADIIRKNIDLFYIGVQGPDILFYYKAYKKNKVNQKGHGTHKLPAKLFFMPALKQWRLSSNPDAAFSYLAGCICHFTLDSQCHPYIRTVEKSTGLSHSEIEAEVERDLMEKDGRDSLRYMPPKSMIITKEYAELISEFWEEITPKEVYRSLNDLKFFSKVFTAPSKCKRWIVGVILRVFGLYENLYGLMINYEENPKCAESTKTINQLTKEAIPIATTLIKEYHELFDTKAEELHERYEKNFDV